MGHKKRGEILCIKLYIPTPLRVLRLKLLGSVLPHRPVLFINVTLGNQSLLLYIFNNQTINYDSPL